MHPFFLPKTALIGGLVLLTITVFQIAAQSTSPLALGESSADQGESEDKEKSLEAFRTVLEVLQHPRCINCHPTGDRPRQGDDHHLHLFNVQRGENDHGGPVQKCQTCHQKENNPYSKVPGAPHWALAPKSMGWFGLSDVEIGKRLVDKSLNGNRSPEDLVHHMTYDSLVLWGWNPGGDRAPVDVPFAEFKLALDTWLANGAHVPAE